MSWIRRTNSFFRPYDPSAAFHSFSTAGRPPCPVPGFWSDLEESTPTEASLPEAGFFSARNVAHGTLQMAIVPPGMMIQQWSSGVYPMCIPLLDKLLWYLCPNQSRSLTNLGWFDCPLSWGHGDPQVTMVISILEWSSMTWMIWGTPYDLGNLPQTRRTQVVEEKAPGMNCNCEIRESRGKLFTSEKYHLHWLTVYICIYQWITDNIDNVMIDTHNKHTECTSDGRAASENVFPPRSYIIRADHGCRSIGAAIFSIKPLFRLTAYES